MAEYDDFEPIGVALGRSDEEQRYQYRGKVWNAEDIYRVMTAAESEQDTTLPDFEVAWLDSSYVVLKRTDKRVFQFFARTGDSQAAARRIADTLNKASG